MRADAAGGLPNFSLFHGFVLDPPDLCTRSLLNVLSTIPDSLRAAASQPRLIVITSMGMTAASRATLPFAIKPIYGSLLDSPHADKLGAERVLSHCSGQPWNEKDKVSAAVLPEGWASTSGLLGAGELQRFVVLRPALLTDGACRADKERKDGKAPYRALKNGDFGDGYRISRKDTAHFIVEDVLPNWSHWEGTAVTLAY